MKNTLLDIYRKDGTKKVLASLISIFIGLFVGAIAVAIIGLTKENIGILYRIGKCASRMT